MRDSTHTRTHDHNPHFTKMTRAVKAHTGTHSIHLSQNTIDFRIYTDVQFFDIFKHTHRNTIRVCVLRECRSRRLQIHRMCSSYLNLPCVSLCVCACVYAYEKNVPAELSVYISVVTCNCWSVGVYGMCICMCVLSLVYICGYTCHLKDLWSMTEILVYFEMCGCVCRFVFVS